MIEWVIFYADNTIFTNEDGPPECAPRNGVLVVYRADEFTGIALEASREGYWVWRNNRWEGVDDIMGWYDYLFHYSGYTLTIFGRTVTDKEYGDTLSKAAKMMNRLKTAKRIIETV